MRWLVVAGAGVLWATAVWRVLDMKLDHDEVEHLHAAWLVGQGQLPYQDFGETHNPLLWYIMAPLLPEDETPNTAVARGRAFMAACSVLTLVLACMLARSLGGGSGLLAPLMLSASSYWSVYAVSIRPDVPMTTLVLLGLWLTLPGPPSKWRSFGAGLAFGAATAMLLKAAIVAAVLIGWTFVHGAVVRSRARLWAAIAMLAGLALPLGCLAAVLHLAGVLDAAWVWVVRLQGPYLLASDMGGFGVFEVILASLSRDPLPWATFALALVTSTMWPSAARWTLLVAILAIIVATSVTRLPNYQYLFPAVALMSVLGADALSTASRRLGSPQVAQLLATLVFLAVGARHAVAMASLGDNSAQVGRMRAVLAITSLDDTVLASPPEHPIFRRDALYIWFNNPELHKALVALDVGPPCDRFRDDPERLKAHPPAVIVKAGARWHPFYGVGALARFRYGATGDPEVLVLAR